MNLRIAFNNNPNKIIKNKFIEKKFIKKILIQSMKNKYFIQIYKKY